MYYDLFTHKITNLVLISTDSGLCEIQFGHKSDIDPSWIRSREKLEEVSSQLTEYFNGDRTTFSILLNAKGTEFQKQVWDELYKIPFGELISYQNLANRINNPKAVRAVGAANGKNPIPIIVPCHRVIGSNGKLTGFAGGLGLKEKLIKLERGGTFL